MNALVKNHGRVFGFILFCVFLQVGAAAQLKANFTTTSQSGCSPLVVYFSDQSTGSPTSWHWDLGNGVISVLKNPSATYFNPGTYTIKLLVKNASGADSVIKQQYITVYAKPAVNFRASDTTGCFPKAIQFTDESQAGSGSVTSRHWDFGDGSVSTDVNPLHVYRAEGSYDVTLSITNSFGCMKAVTRTKYIKLMKGVTASFTINSPGSCSAPVSIQFSNTSNGGASDYYSWNFGDGSSSTLENPSHTYTVNGSYTVRLIVVSAEGCHDTLDKTNLVNLGTNKSDFSLPAPVCEREELHFSNTSSPVPFSAKWSFGDGSFSDSVHPIKAFTTAGKYTVKLVNDFGSCHDSISKTVTVLAKPIAAFNTDHTKFCNTPANVHFSSQATGAVSHFWLFGDGTTSVATNPLHTYYATGDYTLTLIVTNASGCTDTMVKKEWIKIQKPQITLTSLPQKGCAPLTIQPRANIVVNQNIQSYLWKFGDGTSSTDQNPSYAYTNAGIYDVTLLITTEGGCKDSVTMKGAVRVGNKPNAQFTVSAGEVCNSNPVQFTENSTGNVDEWYWNFGDNLSSTNQNPSHVFDGLGKFTVSLIASSNGCADTIVQKDAVNVLPPVSLFSVNRNCSNKYKVEFTDQSIGATTVEWDFGDNSSSSLRNPTHTYTKAGIYKVVLKTFNATCSNINYTYVKIVDEKAKIVVSQTAICKGLTADFSSPSVIDSNIVNWHWDFGDRASSEGSKASHVYANAGIYSVALNLTDVNGCTSSDAIQIEVFGPRAEFTTPAPSACLKDNSIGFVNSSTTDGRHTIVTSVWNFGDGNLDSSNASPLQHHYINTGIYTVSLLVKDNYGCSDELTKSTAVIIAQPVADFYSADSLSCPGKNIAFINSSTGSNMQYQWSFGDGNSSTSMQPNHSYNNIGLHTVKLSVTDQYGCKDSLTKIDYINISLPKAKFIVSDSIGNCPPLIVDFTNQSSGFVSLQWDFGDGNHSDLTNPVHYYNTSGTFYAHLIATGPGGCMDTAIQKIVVKGPSGSFTYNPLKGCNPLTTNFTAQTQNTTSFVWDFSDGTTLSGNGSSISHEYTSAGEFIPKIILTDAAGCNVPIVGSDTIRVYQVTADFNVPNIHFCKSAGVQFVNTTTSNDLITQYDWDFGDASTGSESNPMHLYNKSGMYSVKLTAVTQNGCSSTVTFNNTVTILPAPSITIESITAACAGTKIGFSGIVNEGNTGELSWNWNFENGKTVNTQSVLPRLYNNAGDYSIMAVATALNGCTDTARKKLTIHPLPLTNAGSDQWICLNTETQLHASGADRYQWSPGNTVSCIGCANPTVSPDQSTMYVVTGYNDSGCSSKDSVMISVQHPLILKVQPGDTICAGQQVHLAANGAEIYSWFPSLSVQSPDKANTVASPQISTMYYVVGKDRHNCFTDTADVFIKVWPMPTVNAGTDQTLPVGQALQLKTTVSPDVTSWQWSNAATLSCAACSTTLAKPMQTTTYKVIVKNDGGCSASDNVTVNVICNNGNLFVPNSFSPNGDGMNDRFYPSGTGINRIQSLRVFNRWGEVVFEKGNFSANDASSGWDGRYKGQLLTPDVYIWSCEVICENNQTLSFKGDVTLLR